MPFEESTLYKNILGVTMYYFVPAWYGTDRTWQQTATPWYWMRESIEFDDTINQVRIFKKQKWIGSYCCLNIVHNCAIFYTAKIC